MSGFVPKLPLKLGTQQGYDMITDLKNLSKQNFLMLLLTNPGERIMDNNFGVGIKRLLFENFSNSLNNQFEQRLAQQVAIYTPYINILNISYKNTDVDGSYLSVTISYFIIPLGDYVNLTIQSDGNIIST